MRRSMLGFGIGAPLVIVLIMALPKDSSYAATQRFVLTTLVFATAIIGVTGFSWSRRRYKEAVLLQRYGAASGAVRDTLSYLRHEQRLARRGQLPALAGSLVALELYTVAHWPQAASLAPYQSAFGVAAIAFLASIPISAFRSRGHRVNSYFLKRYLRQQLDHLAFQIAGRRERRQARPHQGDVVTVAAQGIFRIGGFEWRFDDLVKNAVVFGQIGSGKTVAVLNSLLEGLIASLSDGEFKVAGLVLDAKADFYGKIGTLCARYGRTQDLFILDPAMWASAARTARSIAWNPLQNLDDALEVAVRLIAALRLIGLEQGNEGSFWLDSAKVFLRHAIALVRAAALTEAPSLIDVQRLCQEGEEVTPFYHQLIAAISARYPDSVPTELTDAISYFEREWAEMADRQKSGVRGTVTQLLDEFLLPPFREIFTEPSTISIAEAVDQGKIIYVHMPAADRERMSRLVNTLIKLEFQRAVLQRPRKARPSFLLCDEFQTFYTTGEGRGDSDFFERSRESQHANIIAAQNISAFLKRTKNQHDVKNFLGNCAVKIFLRQTEEETNRWASGLFGQRSEIVITTNEAAAFDGSWSRRRHTSYGRATRTLPVVSPDAFTRLAIPLQGDKTRQHAEAVVHLASRGETQHHTVVWPVNPLR